MKPIVVIPNTVLTTPARTVTVFDKKLHTLLAEMKETLLATENPKGVGLAATQVGESLRLFLTKPTKSAPIRVFINPEIIEKSNDPSSHEASEEHGKMEGCLSIPNVWGKVHRSTSLTLKFYDGKGKVHEENVKGFMATIIQHETDHINGILFTQRVLEQKGKLYQVATDDDGKEILDEIPL